MRCRLLRRGRVRRRSVEKWIVARIVGDVRTEGSGSVGGGGVVEGGGDVGSVCRRVDGSVGRVDRVAQFHRAQDDVEGCVVNRTGEMHEELIHRSLRFAEKRVRSLELREKFSVESRWDSAWMFVKEI